MGSTLKLDPENDWVKLAALVPWEAAEERYAARFANSGRPAHPARMALGALLIQLILDAACRPADIACPQDIDLLNQARERAEETVDELCEAAGRKKPRMYRGRARKDDLSLSKAWKRSGKAIRSAVRKRLQYIRRDFESGSHSIPRLSGPALGKPSKDSDLSRQASIRTAVTATLWRVFLGRPRPLTAWAASWHACGKPLLLFNLSRSLRAALALFCLMFWGIIFPWLRSRA